MEREDYVESVREFAHLPQAVRWAAYNGLALRWSVEPYSAFEKEIASQFTAVVLAARPTWFHGGAVGRVVGNTLLPPSKTGADPRSEGDTAPLRASRVYVTWNIEMADWYARQNRKAGVESTIYAVEPQGTLELDPELLRLAILMSRDQVKCSLSHAIRHYLYGFRCDTAKVTAVREVPLAA